MRYLAILLILISLLSTQVAYPSTVPKSQVKPSEEIQVKEDLLVVLLNVFLASHDLENAMRVAQKGVVQYPNKYFWRYWKGQLALWLNRPEKALDNFYIAMKLKEDKEDYERLQEIVFNLSIPLRRYEIVVEILKKEVLGGNLKRIEELVYYYGEVGIPDEAVELLKQVYPSPEVLRLLARLQMNLGMLREAEETLRILREAYGLDVESALNLAHILFAKREFEKALETLLSVKSKAELEDVDYWTTLADIAWFLKDYKTFGEASKVLFVSGKADATTLERIAFFFQKTNPNLSAEASLKAWEKSKKPHHLYLFFDIAYQNKMWERIVKVIDNLSKDDLKLVVYDEYFWIIKATTYSRVFGAEKGKDVYIEAIKELDEPRNLKTHFLWFLIDIKDTRSLKKYLSQWENIAKRERTLWLPYAAGYSLLQHSEKALYYAEKLLEERQEDIGMLIFYGTLLDLSERKEEASKVRLKAWRMLKGKISKNPEKLKEPVILENLLRLSIFFARPNRIKELIEISRGILNEDIVRDVELLWYLMRNEHDRVRYLKKKYEDIQPWMLLNLALNQDDRPKMDALLAKYIDILPRRDRVTALVLTGNIPLAQEYVFKGLEKNPYDYLLYKQMRDLYLETSNMVRIKTSFSRRELLQDFSSRIFTKIFLNQGSSLETEIEWRNYRSRDIAALINLPNHDLMCSVFFRFLTQRGFIRLGTGVRESMRSFPLLSLEYSTYLKDLFNLNIIAGKNSFAPETVYTQVGGVKDFLRITPTYQLTPKTFVSFTGEYSRFYSQDRKILGKGTTLNIEGLRKIRIGYPDYTLRGYLMKGIYSEEIGEKGVVRKLSPFPDFKALPESFWQTGVGFFFGLENRDSYTRVWRPFLNSEVSYNNIHGFGFGIEGGIGGKIFSRDNLSFSVGYSTGFEGIADTHLQFSINYLKLF